MRAGSTWILAFLITAFASGSFAASEGVWIGRQFQPRQCLQIAEGTFDVKRKLCTITYAIRSQADHFVVDGNLRFNERYVPKKVADVELEILLMDENRVCTRQLDMRKNVQQGEASFSFRADNVPSQRYVRTYFVIHYE